MDTSNCDVFAFMGEMDEKTSENFEVLTSAENVEKFSLITGEVFKTYESVSKCAIEEHCDEELVRKCCNGLDTEVHFSIFY
jgi:hypothetical protein